MPVYYRDEIIANGGVMKEGFFICQDLPVDIQSLIDEGKARWAFTCFEKRLGASIIEVESCDR